LARTITPPPEEDTLSLPEDAGSTLAAVNTVTDMVRSLHIRCVTAMLPDLFQSLGYTLLRSGTRRFLSRGVRTLALLVSLVSPAVADELPAAPQAGTQTSRETTPDFLFGRPRHQLGVSGGWLVASQSGGVFDFTRDLLTVNDGDFDTASMRFGFGRSLSPRLDLVAEIGYSGAKAASEYRDFVDNDDLPIVQTTQLSQAPLVVGLRLWLIPRGREISRFAWVANRFAPYVGVGGGTQWYRFRQAGDFVDFVDWSIFGDVFESSGWAATGHVLAGASIHLSRRLSMVIEARYLWANTALGRDFVGFEDIDLNGSHITAGIEVLF